MFKKHVGRIFNSDNIYNISLSLVESQTTTYWKQKNAFSLNETTPP